MATRAGEAQYVQQAPKGMSSVTLVPTDSVEHLDAAHFLRSIYSEAGIDANND